MASLLSPSLTPALAEAGGDALLTDPELLELHSHDVFGQGATPLAIFRPRDVAELQRGIAAATAEGITIVPRGGGLSYTGGYLSQQPALLVDTGALDRIVEVNPEDMTATVEGGVTWEALHRRLKPLGLRAKAWGTLSGLRATVGGGMSQNGLFWGARDGTVVDSALSFDVVLADGSLISTGTGFFRPYGPDLTGLFAADCGALGIKARITLRLVPDGPAFSYGSYAFDDAANFLAAMSEIARAGLAAECFGFDPVLQAQRMKRDSLTSDAKSLLTMMKSQGSLVRGLREGARVVVAGRSFLDDCSFSLHCISEARHQESADRDLGRAATIASRFGGRAVENTIPKILRSNPFPPPNSMVGPSGERWVPVHGFLPHSKLSEAWDALGALYARHCDACSEHHLEAGAMFAAVSPSAALIEPVFFWHDSLNPLHREAVEPAHLARLAGFPENRAGRDFVAHLRGEVIKLFQDFGAAHLQVARTYPLRESHDPRAWALLKAIKAELDPKGLMNPGSLGL